MLHIQGFVSLIIAGGIWNAHQTPSLSCRSEMHIIVQSHECPIILSQLAICSADSADDMHSKGRMCACRPSVLSISICFSEGPISDTVVLYMRNWRCTGSHLWSTCQAGDRCLGCNASTKHCLKRAISSHNSPSPPRCMAFSTTLLPCQR